MRLILFWQLQHKQQLSRSLFGCGAAGWFFGTDLKYFVQQTSLSISPPAGRVPMTPARETRGGGHTHLFPCNSNRTWSHDQVKTRYTSPSNNFAPCKVSCKIVATLPLADLLSRTPRGGWENHFPHPAMLFCHASVPQRRFCGQSTVFGLGGHVPTPNTCKR